MTKRLWIIIIVGVVAIGLTWFLTNKPQGDDAEDPAYKQKLEELHKKQTEKKKERETEGGEGATNGSSGTPSDGGSSTDKDKAGPSGNAGDRTKPVAPLKTSQSPMKSTSSIAKTNPRSNNSQSSTGKTGNDLIKSVLPKSQFQTSSSQGQPPNSLASAADRLNYLSSLPGVMIEPTNRSEAEAEATLKTKLELEKASVHDPFAPLKARKPFPGSKPEDKPSTKIGKLPPPPNLNGEEDGLPTPPDGSIEAPLLAIPPQDGIASGVSVDELPAPPAKPLLIPRMKLNAILDDRVVITFPDSEYRKQYGFKRFITLAPGQTYDSVRLLGVADHKATFEEFGQQTTVSVDPIR